MVKRKQTSPKSLVRFFITSGRLKTELRRGWVKKLGLANPESVADHSYRTALMTMVISDSWGLDTERAVRMALVHDLPEALVGDAMPEERSGSQKVKTESNAMDSLLRVLAPRERTIYRDAWKEFVRGTSEEAKLVRQLDKLEMAIQAREYAQGLGDDDPAKQFWATARKHVNDARLLPLLLEVEV